MLHFVLWVLLNVSPLAQAIELRFIGDQNFPTGTKSFGTELGGLSGLSYDEKSRTLRAISDDRSLKNSARFYRFDLLITEKTFSVRANGFTKLHSKSGGTYLPMSIDPEGIALNTLGQLFVSSEGSIRFIPRLNPAVFEFDLDGKFVGELDIPSKFLPDHSILSPTRGIRDNHAFEGLTFDVDTGDLWIGLEGPLWQDDMDAGFDKGADVRLIQYSKVMNASSRPGFKTNQEFVYRLDSVPRVTNDPNAKASNGLSDLHSFGNGHFLSIERAIVNQGDHKVKTWVKIFDFTIDSATNVSGFDSLKNNKYNPISKHLVLELNSITNLLSKENQSIDNIEGITLGPKLQNGNRTLILVSDNNFNEDQRTQFLAFEVLP